MALVALLVASVLVPTAQAQDEGDSGLEEVKQRETSEVTFYGHLFGMGRDTPMPMNTQFPWGEEDLSQGLGLTTGCGFDPSGVAYQDCESYPNNEVWFYSTAGFVQFKDSTEFDYGGIHNERGLTKDTVLDTSKSVTASFYMSADSHGWFLFLCDPNGYLTPVKPNDVPWPVPCWNWDPGMLSDWVVKATVYSGVLGEYGGMANTAPDIGEAYESGALNVIAEGVSDPVNVQSLEFAGQPTVWRFDVDLGPPQREVIPKEESYMVRFQWCSMQTGECAMVPEGHPWNVNGGEYFPPKVTLPVKNAFDVESVIPQFVYDKLVLLGILNTPWGSYDVDQESIELTITDEDGNEVVPTSLQRLADFSVAHGGHYKPVNITWVWDYKADGLEPGTYDVTVSASNFQGSASAECTGQFTVRKGGEAGGIKLGICGQQTISNEQLRNVTEGAKQDAAGAAGNGDAPLVPQLGIAGASADEVRTVPAIPLAAIVLGFAFLRRRWSA